IMVGKLPYIIWSSKVSLLRMQMCCTSSPWKHRCLAASSSSSLSPIYSSSLLSTIPKTISVSPLSHHDPE
ncbi:hypothetical protein SK128_027341, partial [Halocaridina rubra]